MKPKNLYAAAAVVALAVGVGLLTPSGTAHAQVLPTVPHYDCYNVAPVSQPPTLPGYLTLETQFGTHEVSVAPIYSDLCLPALKKVGQSWEGDLNAPHVECVPIAGPPAGKIVTLTTQFGVQNNVSVGQPIETCMPALKSLTGPPQGQLPTVPHYECYEIDGPSPVPPGFMVTVTDQFFPQGTAVELGEPTRLCLPALKNGEGSLQVPHVECFAITYGPAVNIFAYLLTQFGPYQEVQVSGPARELCMPVLKELGVTIGGIAEAPDADASALETTTSGGSSTTTYAAIAGIAAGVVLLGAGGWYARRRWLS